MKIIGWHRGIKTPKLMFPVQNLITEHQRYRVLPFSRKTFNVFSPSCAQKTAQQDAVYACFTFTQ